MDGTDFLAVHPDPVVHYGRPDGDLRVIGVNPAFESVFGDSEGAVDLEEALAPIQEEPEILSAIQNGEQADTELTVDTVFGERLFRLRNVPGEDGGYLLFTDILESADEIAAEQGAADAAAAAEAEAEETETTPTDSELQERVRELETRNERLETFASVVSHDLRNPIEIAETYTDAARSSPDDEHFDRVEKALDRMRTLIDDVLQLAREGEVVGDTERVTLAAAVRDAWETVESPDADLDNQAGTATLQADPSRLQQLLENLFRNAVEHAGPEVTLTVGAIDEDRWYVADDGPGIPEEDRDEVFEPGFTTSTEGTGLGLSIVHRIAEAHGWDIHVEEGSSGGTRFVISDVDSLQPV
jgi:signal transduction histidine kinase